MRLLLLSTFLLVPSLRAAVGDPQLATDHPWYPGELAMSSFEQLAQTAAEQYERTTGHKADSDHHKALAAWFFRNTHYAHGEEGKENLWGKGFSNDTQHATRDYWTGLFAHGFGLCGTTHAQWTAELDALLGPCRSRVTGTKGHNSFEVFLTGGPYGEGHWALLDHDLSTVIYDAMGTSLLGLDVISQQHQRFTRRDYHPERQKGWLVCALHKDDGGSYASYQSTEYRAGYAGTPPLVQLRKGESLRRWFEPGLDDGKTFVFWGRNPMTKGIPGPERSRTWVNQPEKMHGSTTGTPHIDGQARYGNAVYQWRPDFADGVVSSDEKQVTLEFFTPYIIGTTPSDNSEWGIYKPGGKNGLVLRGSATCTVAVSTDGGASWNDAGTFRDGLDLTDLVKGHRQYHLRFGAAAAQLQKANIAITTVCQANAATFPRLKENGTRIRYEASGRGIVSYGPNKQQAAPRIIEGALDSPKVTLEFATPRGESIQALHVATQIASSNPPSPDIAYHIDYSLDGGQKWSPLLKDGRIERRGAEPKDFWSQSMWSAALNLPENTASNVRVRFHNTGGKRYLRAEGHLLYPVSGTASKVTFAWTDSTGDHQQTKLLDHRESWKIPTHQQVKTRWVEIAHPELLPPKLVFQHQPNAPPRPQYYPRRTLRTLPQHPLHRSGKQRPRGKASAHRHLRKLRPRLLRSAACFHADRRLLPRRHRMAYKQAWQPRLKHTYRAGKVAQVRLRHLMPLLAPGSSVLEFGSGGGEIVFILRELGHDACGIEPNIGYAEYSRDVLGIPVQIGGFAEARVEPRSLDLVTLFHVAEHLEHPVEAFKQASQWLRVGGKLYIEVPNVESRCIWPSSRFHQAHLYNFNAATLAQAGRLAGLEVVTTFTSEDGGNVTAIFEKPETPVPAAAVPLPDNADRITRILRDHTALAHAFTAHPYTRPIQKLRRQWDERRAIARFSDGKTLLQHLAIEIQRPQCSAQHTTSTVKLAPA